MEAEVSSGGGGPTTDVKASVRTAGEREVENDMVALFLTIGLAVFATFVLFRGSSSKRR